MKFFEWVLLVVSLVGNDILLKICLLICRYVRSLGIYMFQMLVGYLLMCAVMTFNGYIFVATVGGYGLGYWLFGLTMMQLSVKNLLKSQDVPIKCKNCTTIDISKVIEYYHNLVY